ncbi:transposase [Kitasatospora sp. NPDC051853]|uniref:transposase n=1 Tax=Kitasatospora sp. NPDC051853 TaxID=3364058 RepID=UPI0037907617
MSDAEWAVVREAMPVPAWLEGRGGQPEGYCHRQLVEAVRYLVAGGIAWRSMPADFPAWDRVYAFFRRWTECDGIARVGAHRSQSYADPGDGQVAEAGPVSAVTKFPGPAGSGVTSFGSGEDWA